MYAIKCKFSSIFLGMLTALSLNAAEVKMTNSDWESIAAEAYIYGYPLITMDITKNVSTNVQKPLGNRAPIGQFANMRTYPDAQFTTVTAPNADTLYSVAWLDLSKEPIILHVPDEYKRYYLMPLLSGWTDVYAVPGTRTTGTDAADFVITGPNWKGELPKNLKEFKSPTNLTWILGRTYSSGTPEDYKIVHKIQNQYTLTPLSSYGKSYTPPLNTVDPSIDMVTPVRQQVHGLTGEAFLNRLAKLLVDNPPSPGDAPIIEKMAQIGIIAGKPVQPNDPAIAAAIKGAPEKALKMIMNHEGKAGKEINGWLFSLKTGNYGTDYLQRAFIAAIGLGANLPEDAVYPMTFVDSTGESLTGENKYIIHFDKGLEPPVKGFWSLTMYNVKFYFVPNPLNRYSLNSSSPFKYNPDGSLDIYIQNESPGEEKESNWLPAPKDNFNLMLRTYWPESPILDGSWSPPEVKKVTLP